MLFFGEKSERMYFYGHLIDQVHNFSYNTLVSCFVKLHISLRDIYTCPHASIIINHSFYHICPINLLPIFLFTIKRVNIKLHTGSKASKKLQINYFTSIIMALRFPKSKLYSNPSFTQKYKFKKTKSNEVKILT